MLITIEAVDFNNNPISLQNKNLFDSFGKDIEFLTRMHFEDNEFGSKLSTTCFYFR